MAKAEIEDTYAEAFEGIFCRVVVTADDAKTLRKAAEDSTATPSVVIGRVEGGVERWLKKKETPDKRLGAILQFWANHSKQAFRRLTEKIRDRIILPHPPGHPR